MATALHRRLWRIPSTEVSLLSIICDVTSLRIDLRAASQTSDDISPRGSTTSCRPLEINRSPFVVWLHTSCLPSCLQSEFRDSMSWCLHRRLQNLSIILQDPPFHDPIPFFTSFIRHLVAITFPCRVNGESAKASASHWQFVLPPTTVETAVNFHHQMWTNPGTEPSLWSRSTMRYQCYPSNDSRTPSATKSLALAASCSSLSRLPVRSRRDLKLRQGPVRHL